MTFHIPPSFILKSRSFASQFAVFLDLPLYNKMLNRKKWKRAIQKQQKKSALLTSIQRQLAAIQYDLSDNYCRFFVKNAIEQHGDSIIIELYIKPLRGTFENIQFRPKIFISSSNFTSRPHIYNDRRLFHPNINMYTCQLVFPQIVRDWNPTQDICTLFRNLKYTIIEPNLKFVPNSQFNKRAAWNYHFNKKNYCNLIIENCPLYLENVIDHELSMERGNNMEVQEDHSRHHMGYNEDDYWSIESITVRKTSYSSSLEIYDDEESVLLLTKQIKCLDMNQKDQGQLAEFEIVQE